MSKVYDSLMKSGRFTAAQNKTESGEFVDSVGELVVLCEKEGFIPRYFTSEPKDKVDEVLKDTKEYLRSLVTEELGLGNLIENAVKTMKAEEEKEESAEELEPQTLDDIEDSIDSQILYDSDYTEHEDMLEHEREQDDQLLKEEADE